MITIQLSGFLTDFTSGERTIVLDGSPRRVTEALALLWMRHAGLRDRVVTERGVVRPHVAVFVNGDHIRHGRGLDTTLAEGDEITILPAISGGRLARHRRLLVAVGLAGALAGLACGRPAPTPAPSPAFDAAVHVRDVEAWRAKHEVDYRRDWVTVAGLYPLKSGSNAVGSRPSSDIPLPPPAPPRVGHFIVTDTTVTFTPAPGAGVQQGDVPVGGTVVVHGGDGPAPAPLAIGEIEFFVHLSGSRRTIRVRDPNGRVAREFTGFRWFPIDPAYRVVGRFIPDAAPNRMSVPNTLGDEDTYATEGVVEFELLGETLRLRPFTTRPKRFYFVFRDASSGEETYETARFLYADLRDDRSVVLDFNQAYNPPCAFNPHTTCPIPLRENRLPVRILAGEMK